MKIKARVVLGAIAFAAGCNFSSTSGGAAHAVRAAASVAHRPMALMMKVLREVGYVTVVSC